MTRFRQRIRRLERRLRPHPPNFAMVSYNTDEERDRKVAALPPTVRRYVCIANMAPSIKAWQAEIKARQSAAPSVHNRKALALTLSRGNKHDQ